MLHLADEKVVICTVLSTVKSGSKCWESLTCTTNDSTVSSSSAKELLLGRIMWDFLIFGGSGHFFVYEREAKKK